MTTLVLPYHRAKGEDVFAALRSDELLTLTFTDGNDTVQLCPSVTANWQAFKMFDGPTPQLLFSQDIVLGGDTARVTVRKVWLLDAGGTVLTAANLPADVTAGDGVAWTIAADTVLFTLAGESADYG